MVEHRDADDYQGKVRYLQHYSDQCWRARDHYKDKQDALLFWVGTVFIIALVAGCIVAAVTNTADLNFGFWNVAAIHTAFIIVFFFYKQKQLSADIFELCARLAEEKLKKELRVNRLSPVPDLSEIRGKYLGKSR